MQARLIPLDGDQPIPLTKDVTVIGRKRDLCDVALDGHGISKLHCQIERLGDRYFVQDLGSLNGTRVNRERVDRAELLPGDELAVSRVRFRLTVLTDAGEMVGAPAEIARQAQASQVAAEKPRPKKAPPPLDFGEPLELKDLATRSPTDSRTLGPKESRTLTPHESRTLVPPTASVSSRPTIEISEEELNAAFEGWYYEAFGQQFGPLTFEALQTMARKTQISSYDKIKQGEDGAWVRAGTVDGLF